LISVEAHRITVYYFQVTALGIPFGCIMMLPFAMLTDTIHHDEITTSYHRGGVFTGLWTAAEKTGLALGPLIAGIGLSFIGFVESESGSVAQSQDTVFGLKLAFSLLPGLFVLFSLIPLKHYSLSEEDLIAQAETPGLGGLNLGNVTGD
ncbi:MAG: MFS transporter, partial [Haliea sp.]|uniref:MFS transporter n=1 Tax=Haliea sp. TaxID=1932666 RepID=UPI0032F067DE